MTRQHLEVKGSDRQNVGKALTVLSNETAAHLRQYFTGIVGEENKLALADMIDAFANGHKVKIGTLK